MRVDRERRVVVTAVVTNDRSQVMCQVYDLQTGGTFDVMYSAPGGLGPLPGDVWIVDRIYGPWRFVSCMATRNTQAIPQRSFREAWEVLRQRSVIDPSFPDAVHPEAPHLAYIGEIRWFAFVPDPYYWPPANGAALQRNKYRELALKLDPDGVTPTFNAPLAAASGSCNPYVCGR